MNTSPPWMRAPKASFPQIASPSRSNVSPSPQTIKPPQTSFSDTGTNPQVQRFIPVDPQSPISSTSTKTCSNRLLSTNPQPQVHSNALPISIGVSICGCIWFLVDFVVKFLVYFMVRFFFFLLLDWRVFGLKKERVWWEWEGREKIFK